MTDLGSMMEWYHRRLCILEGKPDPGIKCTGKLFDPCVEGFQAVDVHDYRKGKKPCEVCGGTGRCFPPIEKEPHD